MVGNDWDDTVNPLESDSPLDFDQLVAAVGPASLLVAIEFRMGRLLRERTTAEDILQDVLFLAWRERRRFEWRGRRSFRAWLLTLIDNRISDAQSHETAQKRGGGAPVLPLTSPRVCGVDGSTGPSFGAPIDSTTPSRIAIYSERAAAMREALASLPDDLRDVVRLRLMEQRPLDEIAALLGIGAAAAAHRFRKGLEIYARRLEAVLTSCGGADRSERPS